MLLFPPCLHSQSCLASTRHRPDFPSNSCNLAFNSILALFPAVFDPRKRVLKHAVKPKQEPISLDLYQVEPMGSSYLFFRFNIELVEPNPPAALDNSNINSSSWLLTCALQPSLALLPPVCSNHPTLPLSACFRGAKKSILPPSWPSTTDKMLKAARLSACDPSPVGQERVG